MTFHRSLIQLLALTTFVAPAFAGNQTPVADRRQERQEKRIENGESSGQVTDHEEKRLENGQEHVDNVEANAKADGVVTPKERAHIEHAENVQSRKIYKAKHNGKTE